MNKEMILNLLRQYGFGLNQKDPYLYDGELGLGIVYSFKDPFYGILTRVYQAPSLKEYEDFLNKYSWYKKNGQKTRVKICLENYKEIMANPKFIYQGKEKNYQELQDIAQNKKETVLKEKNYIKKLRRTVNILMQILDIKRKLQIETRKNYEEFYQNYITKKEAFEKELANYLKEKQEEKETSLPPFIEDLKDVEINKLRSELEKDLTKEELEQQIYNLTDFIKELEVDEEYLKNKYQLICLPLQIKEIKEKEQVLESYKKKIPLFNKKEKLLKELQDIEEKSTLKSIVTYEHYKENEEKRIVEKYAMIPDLDMRTIGDFLAEFDNIKFEEMTYTSEEKEEYSFEEIMEEVESDYQNRSKEEQDFLVGYSYLLNVIKTNRVSEFFNMLRNPNNVMVRVKYFQDIDFTSENKCALTIKKYMKRINSIISYPLIGNLNVFFIDNKIMTSDKVIKASSKKAQAPVLTNGDEVTYVCNLKKGISTYFIPCELKEDIYNDGNLILASDRSLFLIDLSNLVIKKDNDDMLKVVQYEMVKEMKEDYLQADDFKSKKILMYRNITIERGNEI
ncbi:hypothetical protein EGP91_01360 [bacterium]|nr:hypothetical protein [bacterium]